MPNTETSKRIDVYINNLEPFSKEICYTIRKLIHQANPNVKEDWKWRIPVFIDNGLVCGFGAFKNHVSFTFFKGSEMKNMHHLFSEDCTAKYTRTIKFKHSSEIVEHKILAYLMEAFMLNKAKTKPSSKPKNIVIPELLQQALNKNTIAKENFKKMAYTYRKEYALYISEAKRETTKQIRLKKVIHNLEKNIKIHEQYKK